MPSLEYVFNLSKKYWAFLLVFTLLINIYIFSPLWAQGEIEAPILVGETVNETGTLSKEPTLDEEGALPVQDENGTPLLDIDYRDVDIKEVARAFSEISGVNIIVSDEARAMVTLKMSNVDWRTAFEVILDTYNLSYIEKENFIVVTTVERRRMQEESGTLETQILRLNFVDVAEIKKTFESILSSRGRINVDARTNSLIVMDIRDRVKLIEDLSMQLDIRTPQVLIETMVIDVKLTNAFKWGVVETLDQHVRNPDNTEGTRKWAADSSILNVSNAATFNWSKTIFRNADLNTTIQAIITETESEILANPRIVTLDNLSAEIDIVTQTPYSEVTETSGGGTLTGTSFLDIGIKLTVTPHITKDGFISMEVEIEYSADTGADPIGGVPIVDQRKASTNVLVKDGETIVMGGLRRRDVSDSVAKIPILGDIPLIGNLFRKKDKTMTETELVIFITPHLIGDKSLSVEDKVRLQRINQIRNLSEEMTSFENKELLPLRAPIKIGR